MSIENDHTTGNIRSRASKQRCPERGAPLWFVLAIIVLSLRNAGVEGFASGLETHTVQERSKTLQPACRTESGDNAEQTPREAKGESGRPCLLPPRSSPAPGAAPAPLPSDPPALQHLAPGSPSRRAVRDAIPSVGFLTCCQLIARKTHVRLQALLAAFPCSLSPFLAYLSYLTC